MDKAAASAPGKVILFGEHFVVHGTPAIVSSISLRAKVEASKISEEAVLLEGFGDENPAVIASKYILRKTGCRTGLSLRISSEIPQSVGLGSSAAVAVASAAAALMACSKALDSSLVLEAAHEGEKVVHYTPSGIDTSVATYGGAGVFSRDEGYTRVDFDLEYLLILNTGKLRRTGDLVRKVKEFADKNPNRFKEISEEASRIVQEALEALEKGDLPYLGKLMNRNQALLREIGVSSPELEDAISALLKAGAYGAKLTGAGGGGCAIAIADYASLDEIIHKLSVSGYSVIKARLVVEGVRAEPLSSPP